MYEFTTYYDSWGYIISWSICMKIKLEEQTKKGAMSACRLLEEYRDEKW